MKVLLTGASSFTGFWFAKALSDGGHDVTATLKRPLSAYGEGTRAERVRRLASLAKIVDDAPFGSAKFLEVLTSVGCEVLCHHAAIVGDYRNPNFDVVGALVENTFNLPDVVRAFADRGGKCVITTGSVFEQNEGVGNTPLIAFSRYGLSKGLTAEITSYLVREVGLGFGKFVIPNPFGPLEEPRFCAYLMRCWKAGEVAKINTPAYIRDNIHVDLLALAYRRYAEDMAAGNAAAKLDPSGYIEEQGVFAERFAREMRPRLGLACELAFADQREFSEPVMRVNTTAARLYARGWDEGRAWDGVAQAYRG
ncbi:MAG TPA: NAD-dependent epimerase/dehydratase family protein [Rhodopila sp.]|jgi:nucleoside-diphosphate-sugar epimerase|nr:NAD-dependent epimerase/dehydratase family protein [Rhodopila sp.]